MARLKPIHPGEILREEFLVPLKLNPHRLAMALHVPSPTVYDIVSEKRGISPPLALRLGRVFGTSAEFWMTLQADYELRLARNQESEINSQVQPLELQHA